MMRESIAIYGASLPFVKYKICDITYYEFDSSQSDCPEPMLNAMRALQNITSTDERVVMINMQEPAGLYPRIESDFSWSVEELEDDLVKITFLKKENSQNSTDFTHVSCKG